MWMTTKYAFICVKIFKVKANASVKVDREISVKVNTEDVGGLGMIKSDRSNLVPTSKGLKSFEILVLEFP